MFPLFAFQPSPNKSNPTKTTKFLSPATMPSRICVELERPWLVG